MTILRACIFGFALGVAFGTTECSKSAPQAAEVQSQAPPPEALAGNLAPVAAHEQQQLASQSDAPTPTYTVDTQSNGLDDSADNDPPVYADQPPPPIPEYDQPPDPGENYYWTPGYWNDAGTGYYWVPGAWVIAPWVGALWTPPYWDFDSGRYRLHHGYWASHVGFYGGIDYGFGYVGRGYYGGYWNGGKFFYNRTVNNVNVNVVHNVYNSSVPVSTNANRISYNGGKGGLNARPIPAEMEVLRERRTAPVPAQVQHSREAGGNRQQFAAENRNRPAVLAAQQPLPTPYKAPAPRPAENLQPMQSRRQITIEQRPVPATPQPQSPPQRPEPQRLQPQRP